MSDQPLRVVVADHHPMFRHGLCALLGATAGIEVVGEAATASQAVAAAASLGPHVVIMDPHSPGHRGMATAAEVLRALPGVGVLILTVHQDDDLILAAMRAGVRGYLLKDASGGDIVRALRAVGRGEAVFGARVADRVIGFFTGSASAGSMPFPQLTNRERDVLRLLARGLDNHAIARRLYLSEKTIRNRVSDIFTKLAVTGRAEAVAAARDAGVGAE